MTGTGFVAGTKLLFNGVEKTTTFVSATEIRCTLAGGDLAIAGVYPVVARTPLPGGGDSAPLDFTVENVVPALTALSPASVYAGGGNLTVSVRGVGFLPSSRVFVAGVAQTTTYVSPTTLQVTLSAAQTALAGQFLFTVTSPAPGGGTSDAIRFVVVGLPQLALDAAIVTRSASSVRLECTVINVGTANAVAPQIRAATLRSVGTITPIPMTLPTLAPGTGAGAVFDYPLALPPGRAVLSITIVSAGRNITVARLVTIP